MVQQLGGRVPNFRADVHLVQPHFDFPLIALIVGPGGHAMRNIGTATGASVQIRGRRSGVLEAGPGGIGMMEPPEPLMVRLESDDAVSFKQAADMLMSHLEARVDREYAAFASERGLRQLPPGRSLFFFGRYPPRVARLIVPHMWRDRPDDDCFGSPGSSSSRRGPWST